MQWYIKSRGTKFTNPFSLSLDFFWIKQCLKKKNIWLSLINLNIKLMNVRSWEILKVNVSERKWMRILRFCYVVNESTTVGVLLGGGRRRWNGECEWGFVMLKMVNGGRKWRSMVCVRQWRKRTAWCGGFAESGGILWEIENGDRRSLIMWFADSKEDKA